jgi:hypothetical protein
MQNENSQERYQAVNKSSDNQGENILMQKGLALRTKSDLE